MDRIVSINGKIRHLNDNVRADVDKGAIAPEFQWGCLMGVIEDLKEAGRLLSDCGLIKLFIVRGIPKYWRRRDTDQQYSLNLDFEEKSKMGNQMARPEIIAYCICVTPKGYYVTN